MLLQGDALSIQLFIAAAAISALSVATTQAGWTQKWLVRGMFALGALLLIASISWPYLENRIPLVSTALQRVADMRAAWFVAGIVPAIVIGMWFGARRSGKKERNLPKSWSMILQAMETVARPDLVNRYRYVMNEGAEAAKRAIALEEEFRELSKVISFADDSNRAILIDRLAKLRVERDEAHKKSEEWIRTDNDCREALRANIHEQLYRGDLVAKGFLAPHTAGSPERIIPKEEWRFLSLDWEGDQALGPNFEYIAVMIGKPGK